MALTEEIPPYELPSIDPLIPPNIGEYSQAATTGDDDDDDDGVVRYDLYQLQSQDAPIFSDGKRLQDVYGTVALPTFEWVRSVVTGQGSYDPNDPNDRVRREEYDRLAAGSNLPTFQELYGPTIGNIAGDLVGSSLVGAMTDPYVGGSVGEILGAAGQDILPDSAFSYSFGTPLPSTQVADATAQAMKYTTGYDPGVIESLSNKLKGIKVKPLPENQTIFPELANKEVAEATGNLDLYESLKPDAKPVSGTKGKMQAYDTSDPVVVDKLTASAPIDAYSAPVDFAMAQPGTSAYAAGTDLGTGVNYPVGYGAAVPSTPTFAEMSAVDELGGTFMDDVVTTPALGADAVGGITAATPAPDVGYFDQAGSTLTSGSAWAQAGVAAVVSFGINIAMGADPVKAAKQAGASAIGGVIGQALIPIPVVGGLIGSAVGSVVGGRVICNELVRQGLMDRRHVILDYKFTKEHLTPQHVNGYHVWAVHVVKKLRAGKRVRVWKHLATHRANEIAYIYGERDRPDYLGKVYRHIGEPICWVIGAFCEKTDWSVLYNPKEI